MNDHIIDSLLFLTIARNTLCEMINVDGVEDIELAKDFFRDEASDFQIMEILVTGDVPDERFNLDREHRLWEAFKKVIVRNHNMLSEIIEPSIIDEFVFEMGPVSKYGLTSAIPIMEFYLDMGMFAKKLEELEEGTEIFGPDNIKDTTLRDRVKQKTRAAKTALVKAKIGAGQMADKAKWMKDNPGKVWRNVKGKATISKDQTIDKAKWMKDNPGKVWKDVKGKATISKDQAIDTAQSKARNLRRDIKSAVGKTKIGASQMADKVKFDIKKAASTTTGKIGIGLGAAALAAIVAYGATKIYKNYLSKAARACDGKPDKAACMKDFKVKAAKAKIAALKSGMSKCAQSKDPAACKASIQSKINKASV
jgi:hypothetical protein